MPLIGNTFPPPLSDADHAVTLDLVLGHLLDRDDIAAMLGIGVQHLGEAAFAIRLDQHVGQQQREGLAADDSRAHQTA